MEHFVVIFRLTTFFCILFLFSPSLFNWVILLILLLLFYTSLLPNSPPSSPFPPQKKLHGSQNILPFFSHFYKHNMYRKSTQTNMFFSFFFISEYNFLMRFKQSARASHIRTQWYFDRLLFKSTTVVGWLLCRFC